MRKKKRIIRDLNYLKDMIEKLYPAVLRGFIYEARMCSGITKEQYKKLVAFLEGGYDYNNILEEINTEIYLLFRKFK